MNPPDLPANEGPDVVVIGGGPAGLAAALVLGRARRPTVLVDAGPGRNAPSVAVHGLLGHDGTPPALLRRLGRDQLEPYDRVTVVDGQVTGVSGERDDFVVNLADGHTYRARRVVLATGVTDDLPDIEGLQPLWGRSVVHCPYCHGWELRGRALAAIVTEPLDVLLAIKLTDLSDDVVACLHGGPARNADEQAMLDRAGIAIRPERIARLEADGDHLRRIVFADGTSIERAGLFLHPPSRQAVPLASDLGCDMHEAGAVIVDDLGQTSIPGLYAIGDMARRATMPVAAQQVAVAGAEGTMTAIAIDSELLLGDALAQLVT